MKLKNNSLYFHFVRRDCQDNLIGWVFMGVLTLMVVVGIATHREQSFYGLLTLGSLYYLFSLFQEMTVWGGGINFNEMTLSKHYLQSLPLSRKQMFRLCFWRGLFPLIPLFLFFMILPLIGDRLNRPLFAFLQEGFWFFLYFLVTLIELAFSQLMICRQCLLHETLRKTVGKSRRLRLNVNYLLVDVVFTFFMGFFPVGLLFIVENHTQVLYLVLFALLGVPFHLFQLVRSYRQWMWEK